MVSHHKQTVWFGLIGGFTPALTNLYGSAGLNEAGVICVPGRCWRGLTLVGLRGLGDVDGELTAEGVDSHHA